jgi:hypothetical protein
MSRLISLLFFPVLAITACAAPRYSASLEPDRLTLRLRLPKAQTVGFASSLDGFQVHPARKVGAQTWEVQQPANRSFKYFFVVDGKAYTPDCRLKEADDFGAQNCLFDRGM